MRIPPPNPAPAGCAPMSSRTPATLGAQPGASKPRSIMAGPTASPRAPPGGRTGVETTQEFLPLFATVAYPFVATATPAPNRYKEMIHYAGFLGIMDTGQALTRFFQRNSEQAGDLTLYPHKEDEFWLWVHSWAIFVQK